MRIVRKECRLGKIDHHIIDGVERCDVVWIKRHPEEGRSEVYLQSHWEPVPDEVWRDVTAECDFTEEVPRAALWYGTHARYLLQAWTADGYRLRKVTVLRQAAVSGSTNVADAFIVEKRE